MKDKHWTQKKRYKVEILITRAFSRVKHKEWLKMQCNKVILSEAIKTHDFMLFLNSRFYGSHMEFK